MRVTTPDRSLMFLPMRFSRAQAVVLVAAALTTLLSSGVCVLAVLAPAPAPALPLVVAICVGGPLFASWQVPGLLASLRADRSGSRAMAKLRRTLAQLPEVEHPLGL